MKFKKINRKVIFSLVLVSLFGLVGMTAAQAPPPPLPVLFNPLCPINNQYCIDIPGLIIKITGIIFNLIISLSVLMFVWAGALFLFSRGDPGKITEAKKALTYAIIGVIIGLAGNGLIFELKKILGVQV